MSAVFTRILLLVLSMTTAGVAFAQKAITPFSLGTARHSKVPHLRTMELNTQVLTEWRKKAPATLALSLPLPDGSTAAFNLKGSTGIAPQQRVRVSGGKTVQVDRGIHYITDKKEGNQAALSLFNLGGGHWQLSGMVMVGRNSYVLAPDSMGVPVIFPDAEMPGKNPFQCHTDELPNLPARVRGQGSTPPPTPQACANSVKLFIEADYQAYADNNFSTAQTVAWINSVWNVVGKLYRDVGVPIEVVDTYINTRPDNYPTRSSGEALGAFGDTLAIRQHDGDLSHLMSTKSTSLGGIAYLDVLCQGGFNYAFSNCDVTFAQVPAYSWTINVLAHEMGHNMGSHHTQWCGWELSPGVFGSIDSCYATEDAGSGQCYTGPVIPRAGTIMSYCHLTGTVNLGLGFGPLPSAVILDRYTNASCLTPGGVIPNVTIASLDTACAGEQVKLTVSAVANATYRWTGPNGFTSSVREPVIPSFAANQAGQYTVTITQGTCTSSGLSTTLVSNCVAATPLGNYTFCPGDVTNLAFRANFTPTAGNIYQAELSNAAGAFSLVPSFVGTLSSSQTQGTLAVTIPKGTPAGTGYKLRIRATGPSKLGEPIVFPLTVRATAAAPTVTGASRTTPGTLTLLAVPPTGASSVWYNDSITTTVLARGNSYTTPSLSTTRKYWVQSEAGRNQRIGEVDKGSLVGSFINNPLRGMYFTVLAPMVLDSVRVFAGTSGTLAFVIKDQVSRQAVFRGTAAITANPSSGQKVRVGAQLQPGSYVINSEGSVNMNSLYRILDPNNSLPYPYDLNGLLTIDSATVSGTPLNAWYFYFDWRVKPLVCASNRVSVTATIQSCTPPSAPAAQGTSVCAGTTVSLAATGAPTGYGYRWYDRASGGTVLPSGQAAGYSFTASVTDTFYVGLQSLTDPNCSSPRTRVIVNVQARPNAPTGTADSACPGTSVTLRAAGAANGQTYEWFDRPTGGAALQSGAAPTYSFTPTASRDTLYVQLRNSASPNCTSNARTPIVFRAKRVPAAVTAASQERCGPGTVTLTATTGALDTVLWQNGQGQTLARGRSFTTPNLSATTNYQVRVKSNGGCLSTATPTSARISSVPSTPTLNLTGGVLTSSNPGRHVWLRNGVPTSDTSNRINAPGLGSWQAITVLDNCRSDTSAPFVVVSVTEAAVSVKPQVFPNPAETCLMLQHTEGYTRYELANLLGQTVGTGLIRESIDVRSLTRGVYFLKLQGPGRSTAVLRFEKR